MSSTEILVQLSGAIVTLVLCGIGGILAFSKLKENAITRQECDSIQNHCRQDVCRKIDELKILVVDLHKSQKDEINSFDKKREEARTEYVLQILAISKAIGRIEGRLNSV